MGRITIFSMDSCSQSLLTKKEFQIRQVPFTEICLSEYPQRRPDMMSLSNQIRVPQVFINSTHIGGAEDALKFLKSWDKNNQSRSPLEMYESLIGQASDPTDIRLEPPMEPPVVGIRPPLRNTKVIEIPASASGDAGGVKKTSVLAMTELLKRILPRRDLKYNLTTYRNAFKGCELVDCLMNEFSIQRHQAASFAQTLQSDHYIFQHVANDHEFRDTNTLFFRLYCDQSPDILNSYREWTERVDPNPMALLTQLKMKLGKNLADHTDSAGKINYKEAACHKDLPAFNEAVCELQGVDFERMPYATKLAFSINLYNIMIRYAFVRVGVATSELGRSTFYSSVGFNVGGYTLTFQDLENGILRGNRKAPHASSRQFVSNDRRRKLVIPEVDCRIHFGLNCGAKSCPPVHTFTAEYIEEELRIVAQEFCEDKKNVKIDGHTLHLSKIFSWYMEDFGGNSTEIAKKVLKYLRGSKAAKLRDLIAGGTLTIKYMKYDWTTDASDFVVFSGSAIKSDTSRFR
jgi:glutaredoxin